MNGYAASLVFTRDEQEMLDLATRMVDAIPEDPDLRCHELSRAVCAVLTAHEDALPDVAVVDGKYTRLRLPATPEGIERGAFVDEEGLTPIGVEHSWIEIPRAHDHPTILDVYCVGSLPMVQLRARSMTLPHAGLYQATGVRKDIIEACVTDLTMWLLKKGFAR